MPRRPQKRLVHAILVTVSFSIWSVAFSFLFGIVPLCSPQLGELFRTEQFLDWHVSILFPQKGLELAGRRDQLGDFAPRPGGLKEPPTDFGSIDQLLTNCC
jgi:hypothetical protein